VLSQDQGQGRIETSKTFLEQVRPVKHNGRRNFATLDESWCCCHTDYESAWLSGDETATEWEQNMIASQKLTAPSDFFLFGFRKGQ
jgi:hypothetical protein